MRNPLAISRPCGPSLASAGRDLRGASLLVNDPEMKTVRTGIVAVDGHPTGSVRRDRRIEVPSWLADRAEGMAVPVTPGQPPRVLHPVGQQVVGGVEVSLAVERVE